MAYTAIWDETLPTGGEAANTIDDIVRAYKRDVRERFNDIFDMPNFATDPLRPYNMKFSSVPGTNDIIVGSAGGLRFRDSTNAFNNLLISDAGAITSRAGITGTSLVLDAAAHGSNATFKNAGARYGLIADGQFTLGDGTTNLVIYADAGNSIMFVPNATGASKMTLSTTGILIVAGQQITLSGSSTAVTQILFGNSSNFGTIGSIYSSGAAALVHNASQGLGADSWLRSLGGQDSYALTVGLSGALKIYRSPSGTVNGTIATYFTQTILDISSAGNAVFLGSVSATQLLVNSVSAGPEALRVNGTIWGNSGFALTAGDITISTAVSRLIPGATSFSHRNNANSADNLIITDAGLVTVRNGVTITAGPFNVSAAGSVSSVVSASTVLVLDNTLAAANFRLVLQGNRGGAARWGIGYDVSDQFVITNAALNAANILITDTGAITVRSTISGITTLTATTVVAALTGNASSATILATPRAINGVNFDGSAPITVTAAAGTLTGGALAAGVLASSLTSVGILASPHFTSPVIDSGGLGITAGNISLGASSNINNGTGSIAVLNTTTTTVATIATPSAPASYLITALFATGVSGGNGNAYLVASWNATTGWTSTLSVKSLAITIFTIDASGNIQVAQNSGNTQTVGVSWVRLY